jgi:hypothetical protein
MVPVSQELERHAAECREMAMSAYDPAYRAALTKLATSLETRSHVIDEAEWLKFVMTPAYSPCVPHLFR